MKYLVIWVWTMNRHIHSTLVIAILKLSDVIWTRSVERSRKDWNSHSFYGCSWICLLTLLLCFAVLALSNRSSVLSVSAGSDRHRCMDLLISMPKHLEWSFLSNICQLCFFFWSSRSLYHSLLRSVRTNTNIELMQNVHQKEYTDCCVNRFRYDLSV